LRARADDVLEPVIEPLADGHALARLRHRAGRAQRLEPLDLLDAFGTRLRRDLAPVELAVGLGADRDEALPAAVCLLVRIRPPVACPRSAEFCHPCFFLVCAFGCSRNPRRRASLIHVRAVPTGTSASLAIAGATTLDRMTYSR